MIILLLTFLLISESFQFKISTRIETKSGWIEGHVLQTVNLNKTYFAFQGIPYAEKPINDLRFKAPKPVRWWKNTLIAKSSPKQCVQNEEDKGSEDCLYLNIYVPKCPACNKLPVMIYIHGGYFLGGDSSLEHYGPDYFLEETDVVIVTFNYRLGVFGFLSTEDSVCPGNNGLKDQILALKWIKGNIDLFGGDSNQITIFGESAGAASVSYLTQTTLTKGLFQKAIMQSGTSLNLWALSKSPRKTAFLLGSLLGILTDDSKTLIEELKKIDLETLLKASTKLMILESAIENPIDGIIFGPSLEHFNKLGVITYKSHQNLLSGNINNISCIIGYNSEEGVPVIEMALKEIAPYLASYDLFPHRLVPSSMNLNPIEMQLVGLNIKQRYFGISSVMANKGKLIKFVSDNLFLRPINEAVKLYSTHLPVYYYKFSYEGEIGNNARKSKGVGHAEDLKYFWKSSKDYVTNPKPSDLLTRKRLVRMWINFAHNGNPTPHKDPLLMNVTWLKATPSKPYCLNIGSDLELELCKNDDTSYWDSLFSTYAHAPFNTY